MKLFGKVIQKSWYFAEFCQFLGKKLETNDTLFLSCNFKCSLVAKGINGSSFISTTLNGYHRFYTSIALKFQRPDPLLDFYKDDDNDDVPVDERTPPPARPSPPTTCVHPRSEDTQTTLPAITSVQILFKLSFNGRLSQFFHLDQCAVNINHYDALWMD